MGKKPSQFDIGLATWHPQHDNRAPDVIKSYHPIHPLPFHYSLSFDFESQVEKKSLGGSKIVHDDAHMINALDLHVAHLRLLYTVRERRLLLDSLMNDALQQPVPVVEEGQVSPDLFLEFLIGNLG